MGDGVAIEPKVMQDAIYRMWLDELNATTDGKPDWTKRRAAAEQICKIVGIRDALEAITQNGILRAAPPWPAVDIVPVGGGPGMITCEVRTYARGRGKLAVKVAIGRFGGKVSQDQIAEALERGKFELKKLIG